ncbi:MAG TPA: hypothetical protein VG759_07890 [Candidatus Angelobacter sp.]|jgi:hypothetical protein|nr:hypothetical protein [Candidatus Angelobacter sp.]
MRILSLLALVIPICLQAAILVLLAHRGLRERFRWFFIYILYYFLVAIMRLIVSDNKPLYFNVYWATSALAILFTFLAFRESFLNVLAAFARIPWFRRLFWICIALATIYSLAKAIFQPPILHRPFESTIIFGQLTLEYLIIGASIFFFGAVAWYRIRKYQWEYGVILGFFANAALSNFGFLARSIFGTKLTTVSEVLPAVAYIVAAATWLASFIRKEPPRADRPRLSVDLTPEQIMADLKSYWQFIANARAFLWRKRRKR